MVLLLEYNKAWPREEVYNMSYAQSSKIKGALKIYREQKMSWVMIPQVYKRAMCTESIPGNDC